MNDETKAAVISALLKGTWKSGQWPSTSWFVEEKLTVTLTDRIIIQYGNE